MEVNVNTKKKKSGGILAGLLFLILGIVLLWFNEGRTVKTAGAIKEAEGTYIEVSSDKVDSSNEGKLIVTNGKLTYEPNEMVDDLLNVSVESPVLKRKVEVYQWVEECESTGNDTTETCTYKKEWKDSNDVMDPGDEQHKNVTKYGSLISKTFTPELIKMGDFEINESLLLQINSYQELNDLKEIGSNKVEEDLEEITNPDVEDGLLGGVTTVPVEEDPNKKVIAPAPENNVVDKLRVEGNYYVTYENEPEIGDARVSYSYVTAENISAIGVQTGSKITPFNAKSGVMIYNAYEGILNGKQIIKKLTDENTTIKWVLRILGTILIVIGVLSILSPIQKLLGYIPLLGNIANSIIGLIGTLIGLLISFIIITIAWIRYRPWLIIVIVVLVVLIVIVLKNNKKKQAQNVVTEPVTTNVEPVNNDQNNNVQ